MRRRRFLCAAGVGVLAGTGGCLGVLAGDDGPAIPDGMTVETRHWVSDILEHGIYNSGEDLSGRYYTLVASRSAAESKLVADAESDGFVRDTDFSSSYVVVVQGLMSSGLWLELSGIRRVDGGIEVTVLTGSPDEPVGDDAAPHSLAIRVTDEKAGVPERLVVWLDGVRVEN